MAALPSADLVRAIDAALPQTQCQRCDYDGCLPYAEAVAAGDAINRCPPGGDTVIAAHGEHAPLAVARIDEAWCIGCTLCIDACPVDAIVGAAKRMHAVLPALCTGCELCLPPCPVDCIDMVPAGRAWSPADAHAARARFDARSAREARRKDGARKPSLPVETVSLPSKSAAVAAALARARARRATSGSRTR